MNIILIGAPGSGKGSLSAILCEQYNYVHISTGNLVRDEIAKNTPLGKNMAKVINKGKLVDSETIYSLLNSSVKNAIKENKSIVFDGFPRTIEQAEYLSKIVDIELAIFLDCSEKTILNRLLTRRLCPKCGFTTNTRTDKQAQKEICAKCGSKLVVREDDNIDTITNRFQIFNNNNAPILRYYGDKKLLIKINANKNINYMAKVISQIMEFYKLKEMPFIFKKFGYDPN
ncbi:MAG: nucleoside monophosphate kinase [Mycoplasmataceae bacterium]|jgi:adenylate kinase|nr:nucleoside monophosphate kinase [Mycoplasmataceae bacterium]